MIQFGIIDTGDELADNLEFAKILNFLKDNDIEYRMLAPRELKEEEIGI